jgi:hypothetical protein
MHRDTAVAKHVEADTTKASLDPVLEAAIAKAVERGVAAAIAKMSSPTRRMVDSDEAMEMLNCSRTTLYRDQPPTGGPGAMLVHDTSFG